MAITAGAVREFLDKIGVELRQIERYAQAVEHAGHQADSSTVAETIRY